MVDYVRLQSVAQKLINENGRSMTLNRLSITSADANKPWRGTDNILEDTVDLIGVFVETKTSIIDGTLLKEDEKSVLANAIDSQGKDLTLFNRLIDGSDESTITKVNPLRPGDLVMMYEIVIS